jgi:hypothetical protein
MSLELFTGHIAGVTPPPLLIFFHIPKTGGTTVNLLLRRCFRDKHFDMGLGDEPPDTFLWTYSTSRIAERYHQLYSKSRREIRCVSGEHISYDVAAIFDRPSKFFTIVRDPVDRFISSFYFSRKHHFLPSYRFVKDLTLEQYLESGIGLDYDNHQVRMLSGRTELDVPWSAEGRPIFRPTVERLHLEMAKRNIEERFVVAAGLEQFIALVWYLKRLYDWPLRRTLFRRANKAVVRSRLEAVTKETRKHLETLNQYDVELHKWVKTRFNKQIAPLEPQFSREICQFDALIRNYQRIDQFLGEPVRRAKGYAKSLAKLSVHPILRHQ